MELDLQSLFGLHLWSCTVLIAWDPAIPPPPPPSSRIWVHIQGHYWSAKIDDVSLWPPLISPHRPGTWAGSRAGSPVSSGILYLLPQTGFSEKLRMESVIFIILKNCLAHLILGGFSGALIDCGWCIPGHVHVGQPAGVTPEIFIHRYMHCCGSGIRCLFDPWIRDG